MSERHEKGGWPVPAVLAVLPCRQALRGGGTGSGRRKRRRRSSSRTLVLSPSVAPRVEEGQKGAKEPAPRSCGERRRQRRAAGRLLSRKLELSGAGRAATLSAWRGNSCPGLQRGLTES